MAHPPSAEPASNAAQLARLSEQVVATRVLLEAESPEEAASRILETVCEALGVDAGALSTADLEARERAEEAAGPGEDEAKYRRLIEQLPLITYMDARDEVSSALYMSPQIERSTGHSPQEWLADPDLFVKLLHPDDRERVMAEVERTNQSGEPFRCEYRLVARDGTVIWFRDEDVAVDDAAGEAAYTQGYMLDITERKLVEEELRESEERLRGLLETANEGIWMIDRAGSTTFANEKLAGMFGHTVEEMAGRSFFDFVDEDARAEALQALNDQRQGLVEGHDFRFRRKDGTEVWCWVSTTPHFDAEGEFQGGLAMITDITERKLMEQELRQAKETAEQATRTKSEFLANMSHEIRTPMNAVIGMTGLLLDTPLDSEQHDYVETVRTSSDALLSIINDILDFSKIEAGKLELEDARFGLRDAVESSLELVAAKAAEKGLELACIIEEGTPQALLGDVTRLRQVLLNLLSNATKFTHEGEIVVHVSSRPLGGDRHEIDFAVKDTGIGIPADRMDRLFESFSQVDSSVARHYGGTGLGLTISKRLAELMGGSMSVASEVGHGSTFSFTITAGAVASERAPEHAPELTGKRLLIVDDNATNRRVLTLQARSWDMEPVAVEGGDAALRRLRSGERFDLAILDMQMPGMDGITLAREIRALEGGGQLPLVMLTSLGRREEGSEEAGFAAYLSKPIKSSALYDALVAVFDHQPARADDRRSGPARLDPGMAARHPLRILLAEDNAVNQKVALRFLEKMGYRADVAGNGIEALEAVERQPYDVVLMDVQMPEMDGLQATNEIRSRETVRVQPRIVAMTANALEGDREMCLDAGMDDYVTKPIHIDKLVTALERCPARAEPAAAAPPAPAANGNGATPALDPALLAGLRESFGEDADELLGEIATLYRSDAAGLLEQIRAAVEGGDAPGLDRAAHTLKGSSANVGAATLAALCLELERLGRDGTTAGAAERLPAVEAEYERVRAELEGLGAAA